MSEPHDRQSSPLVWESTLSEGDEYRLYDMDISVITSLTEQEVREILVLLKQWGYQWDDDVVCWGGFEMDAGTLR